MIKDYVSNRLYFTQKSPTKYHILFIFEMLVVIVLLLFGRMFYPIAFPLLLVASLIECNVIHKHVSDKYFETFLPDEKREFITEFERIYQPIDPRLMHANAVASNLLKEKHGDAVYGGEYRFLDSDFKAVGIDRQIRIGRDGVVRSSVFCFTGLQIDPRRVCLMTRRIGMTEDLEKTEHEAIPYTALSSVKIEVTPLSIKSRAAHCIEMVFYGKDEEILFRLPVHGSVDNDDQVEKITEMIEKAHAAEAASV